MKYKDYICTPSDSGEAVLKSLKSLNMNVPDCYMNAEDMAELSLKVKRKQNHPFAILPFCHTVEAESFGGIVNYGDYSSGPRTGGYVFTSVDEVSEQGIPDFNKGKIREVIRAAEILNSRDETVLYELSGPITILNGLMDAGIIFKSQRKNPEGFKKMLGTIEKMLLLFTEKLVNAGVKIISYADSAGGLNILGPRVSEFMAEEFTVPFLMKMQELTRGKCLIHLCPKTFWLLESGGFAEKEEMSFEGDMTYGELMKYSIGRTDFMGDRCLNLAGTPAIMGKVSSLRLK